MSALFKSTPTKEVVKMCIDQVKKDLIWATRSGFTPEEFGDLLALTVDTTYFQYQRQIYQQMYGATMKSTLSPVITNILNFMVEYVGERQEDC